AFNRSLEFVKEKKLSKWIVHAQSLGGIITMRALEDFDKKDQIDLLVLDCTFDSYDDVAFDILKKSWVTFLFSPLGPLLVSDAMAPQEFFKIFTNNTLVMHGSQDPVIANKFGRRIFDRIEHDKKERWLNENAGHINVFHSENSKSAKSKYLDTLSKILGRRNN